MLKAENVLGHTFIPGLLKANSVVFDCGANHGGFAQWISGNTSALVYSFEPDPRLFVQLPRVDRVEFFDVAVSGKEGVLHLGLGEKRCSSAIYRESELQQTVEVRAATLHNFANERNIHKIDLIKLDIEGAELDVLEYSEDDFLASVTQITVEFHDFLDKKEIPRIRAAVNKLEQLGFWHIRLSHNTWGDCLFINRRHVSMSKWDTIKAQMNWKYIPGLFRVLTRMTR